MPSFSSVGRLTPHLTQSPQAQHRMYTPHPHHSGTPTHTTSTGTPTTYAVEGACTVTGPPWCLGALLCRKVATVAGSLDSLTRTKEWSWSSSLVRCSMRPRYCSTLESDTPALPPSISKMALPSQPDLLKRDSTPGGWGGVRGEKWKD